jgi:hypothetical protein
MTTRALKASWFHKWIVNPRQRPEEIGALLQARMTNQHPMPQVAQALHHDLLNPAVLPIIHGQYGTYLLPQAFPEGAPAHPCYPTGHGTVGGARPNEQAPAERARGAGETTFFISEPAPRQGCTGVWQGRLEGNCKGPPTNPVSDGPRPPENR